MIDFSIIGAFWKSRIEVTESRVSAVGKPDPYVSIKQYAVRGDFQGGFNRRVIPVSVTVSFRKDLPVYVDARQQVAMI